VHDPPVLKGPEELTSEWLTAALRSGGGAAAPAVTSVRCERIGVGESFAASLVRVFPTYRDPEAGAPRTFVAKFAATAGNTRALLTEFDSYGREVLFYTEIGERAGVPIPRCYYGACDATSGDFVLLLEDLAPAEPGNQIRGATREQTATVVRHMAELHARFRDSQELRQTQWLWVTAESGRLAELYRDGLALFRERVRDRHPLLVEMAEQIDLMLPYLSLEQTPSTTGTTLIHGDLRLGNALYPGPAGGRFALIDWQGVRAGHGAQDVANWLAQSLDIDERRACEREMLHLYHRTLKQNGVRRYPFWQLKLEYRLALLGVLAGLASVGDHLEELTLRGDELLAALHDRIEAALRDWKLPRSLKIWTLWFRLRALLDRVRGA
jgi:thiamine kinase-like enzyme